MALIHDKMLFYVNSNDRISGTSSDFMYSLQFDNTKSYDRVGVLQCSIPVSYYLIEQGQNTFILIEGTHNITIIVPPGNYNRKSLSVTLASILTSSSVSGWTYTCTYPSTGTTVDQGLYNYGVSGNSSQPSFKFGIYCYEALGFNENSTNVFVSNSLNSTNVIKLTPQDQLFLHSDIGQNKNDDILQDIYASGTSNYSTILFQNFDVEAYSKTLVSITNSVFRFYLTDANDNVINLNGQNLCITLILYKKNTTWDIINRFIKTLTVNMFSRQE